MNLLKTAFILTLICLLLSGCSNTATSVPLTIPTEIPPPTATVEIIPTATELVPTSVPTPADTGWQADYFNNDQFQGPAIITRVDPEPSFDWQFGSPAVEIPVDFFTVRWTRCLDLEEREYFFTISADDYARVLMDDVLVLETPLPQGTEVPFAVSKGSHCIKVEYREFIGHAFVFFSFK